MDQRQPTKKELKVIRRTIKKAAEADIRRIHHNVLAHKPWWLPRFIWSKMVKIVLLPANGQDKAGE